jgi:hypothetical protein
MRSICTDQKVKGDFYFLVAGLRPGTGGIVALDFKPGFIVPKVSTSEFVIEKKLDIGQIFELIK